MRTFCEHCGRPQESPPIYTSLRCRYCGRHLAKLKTQMSAALMVVGVFASVACLLYISSRIRHPGIERVYTVLRNEPVLLPDTTPFDQDYELKSVYLDGYKTGWDDGIHQWLSAHETPWNIVGHQEHVKAWRRGITDGFKRGLMRVGEYQAKSKE